MSKRKSDATARRLAGLLAWAAVLVLSPWPVHAARLVEIDRDTQRIESPPAAVVDPACLVQVFGLANGGSNMDGRQGFIEQEVRTEVRATDASCALAASATALFQVSFTIEPDAGESIGDPVALCAQTSGFVSAARELGYQARARLGDVALAGASVIKLNSSTVASLGPFDETADTNQGRTRVRVTAAIGDSVELQVGNQAQAFGSGVGKAEALSKASLRATVGGCPDPAPAPVAAPLGLAGLMAALALGGAWMLHRRRGFDAPR